MFAMTDVMPRPKTTPLGTKSQITEWTDSIPDLDEMYQLKSYEQLEGIINAWLAGDDENAESGRETENDYGRSNKTPTKTSSKPASKKSGSTNKDFGDDIDDAFADLDEDLGF